MYKKSRIIKIAALVFCTGVLLGGIGTGMAIAEYTSLEYAGEHVLGEENMTTESIDVAVVPEDGKKIRVNRSYWVRKVNYGEQIPADTIRYVVKYNTKLMEFSAEYREYEYDSDSDSDGREDEEWLKQYQGTVYLDYWSKGSEFDLIMSQKDRILEDLKQGKFGSYQIRSIESVEVWANPEMKPFLVME